MLWLVGGVASREPRQVRLVWRGNWQRMAAEREDFTHDNHRKCSLEDYVKSPTPKKETLYEQYDIDVDSVAMH